MDASETNELRAFELVTAGYYRDPDARAAGMALRQWLRFLAASDDAQLGPLTVLFYLFARISQVSEAARDEFEPILRGFEGPRAELPKRLLTVPSEPAFPNALDIPIERPENLDLLWAEFFVTGLAAPILRIISTLDWEDRVRQRLDHWVHERSLFGGSKRRAIASKLASVGLVVDVDRSAIVSSGDLDCLCFSIAEQHVPIFTYLPFALTPEELLSLGTKASALWSLRLNAKVHELVVEICRAEAQRPGGPARLRLIEAPADGRPFAL